MWNVPTKKRLSKIPTLYETEHIPLEDKLIFLHFFIGGSHWYAAEFDGTDFFFGYIVQNSDYQNGAWGHFRLSELKKIRIAGRIEVDCEREEKWRIGKASEIKMIKV